MAQKPAVGSLQMQTEEGEDAYRVSESAYEEMLNRGIRLPERPEFDTGPFVDEEGIPRMSNNIQDLSANELGEMYHVFQRYFSYVLGQLVEVKNRYREAKASFEFIKSKVRLGKDGRQQDKTDKQITDRRYVIANAKMLELQCLYELLDQVREKYDADLKMISRNITLREQEIKKSTRGMAIDAKRRIGNFGNFGNKPHPSESDDGEEDEPQPKINSRRPPRRRPPRGK